MIGRVISHYQIIEKLGGGGMGVVFKARDTVLPRFVALKMISPDFLTDPETTRAFIREAQAASALNHPNILTVHDLIEADGDQFIVMELVEGQTLRNIIGKKGVELKELLRIAAEVTAALAAAHRAGIVHRDLKPENIMVRKDGNIKVVDFGLAKLLLKNQPALGPGAFVDSTLPMPRTPAGQNVFDTEKSRIAGTAPYMSPEQLQAKDADNRSDIFSFGVLLYEMVTGQQPFQGHTTGEIIKKILEDEPLPVTQLAALCPDKLGETVSKCLEKDRADRYQHMEDVAVDLRRVKRVTDSGRPIPQPTLSGTQPTPKRSLLYALIGALLLGGIAAYIIWILPPPAQTVLLVKWGKEVGNASVSPDGSMVAFDSDANGRREIYLMLASGGEPRQISSGLGEKSDPRFSPDGTQLLYSVSGENDEIWIAPTLGSSGQKLISDATSADWSPDGRKIAYGQRIPGQTASLWVKDLSDGSRRAIFLSKFPDEIRHVRWSPEGKWIFSAPEDGATLITPDGATSKSIEFGQKQEPSDVAWSWDGSSLLYSACRGGMTNIWKLRISDGKAERVTTGGGEDFSPMSLRGAPALVYAHGTKIRPLFIFSAEAKKASELVAGARLAFPTISRDGKQVAYIDKGCDADTIWTIGRNGEGRTRRAGGNDCYPAAAWSPDLSELAYSSLVEKPTEYYHIFLMKMQDGTTRQLTSGSSDEYVDDWSQDGKTILFTKVANKRTSLAGIHLQTLKESFIAENLQGGTYSDDGRWILALRESQQAGEVGLWVLASEGGQPTKVLSGNVTRASWAQQDEAIVYSPATGHKGEVELWKLPVREGRARGSPSFLLSFPASFGAASEWDVAKDLSWVVYPHALEMVDFYKLSNEK